MFHVCRGGIWFLSLYAGVVGMGLSSTEISSLSLSYDPLSGVNGTADNPPRRKPEDDDAS